MSDTKSAKSAKGPSHADLVAEHLGNAEPAALSGVDLVFHKLDVAFVHALAGAEDEALKAIDAADAEAEKYAPNLAHLLSHFHLRKARVHAALGRK